LGFLLFGPLEMVLVIQLIHVFGLHKT